MEEKTSEEDADVVIEKTKKVSKVKRILKNVDVSKKVCDHLIGDEHTPMHRYLIGIIIMTVGVGIAKITLVFEMHFIHILGDIIGYAIHGIGAIPFAETVLKKGKENGK